MEVGGIPSFVAQIHLSLLPRSSTSLGAGESNREKREAHNTPVPCIYYTF